jgi:hypothetical protein
VGCAFYLGHYLLGGPGKVRIDYQDVFLELDPHAICRLALVPITLPEEDAGDELPGGFLPGQYLQGKHTTGDQQQASDSHARSVLLAQSAPQYLTEMRIDFRYDRHMPGR